jgi:hypothetical protein
MELADQSGPVAAGQQMADLLRPQLIGDGRDWL